jgi:hypothetical protein
VNDAGEAPAGDFHLVAGAVVAEGHEQSLRQAGNSAIGQMGIAPGGKPQFAKLGC